MSTKNFGAALPLFLILGHLGHISYLLEKGVEINFPNAIILAILVIFYGLGLYFDHIKKPDANKIIEAKWEEFEKEQAENRKVFEKENSGRMTEMESKVSGLNLSLTKAPITPISPKNMGW